jgi:Cytidylate kinase-like family
VDTLAGYDQCLTFVRGQTQARAESASFFVNDDERRAVTISRQSSCGGHVIAEKLAEHLRAHSPRETPQWTIFDRDLMKKVMADHQLPAHIARLVPEDRISQIDDILYDLFNFRPAASLLLKQTAETILHLAELGNVIIFGRGANVITARMPGMLHIRLVAPLESRVERRMREANLSRKAALQAIQREDLGRKRYLKQNFNKDIDDPLLYHLVVNTSLFTPDAVAQLIGDLVLNQNSGESPLR